MEAQLRIKDSLIKSSVDKAEQLMKETKTKISCHDCEEDLSGFSEIKRHILKKCTESYEFAGDGEDSDDFLEEESYNCENCSYTSASEQCLKLHQKNCENLK